MDSDVPLNFEQVQGHICFSFVGVFFFVYPVFWKDFLP